MLSKFSDLRFTIGLFFTVVGSILLATFLWGMFLSGPSDLVGGVHLNLLGGSMMLIFGLLMLTLAGTFKRNR